jgi:hypothetical protein
MATRCPAVIELPGIRLRCAVEWEDGEVSSPWDAHRRQAMGNHTVTPNAHRPDGSHADAVLSWPWRYGD